MVKKIKILENMHLEIYRVLQLYNFYQNNKGGFLLIKDN